MTMPLERTRSLRWGWELLSKMPAMEDVPAALRSRAASVLTPYPAPTTVLTWIDARADRIPEAAAEAIEAAGQLFLDLQLADGLSAETRRELLFVRRHFPPPGEAISRARAGFLLGLEDWLAPEPTSTGS